MIIQALCVELYVTDRWVSTPGYVFNTLMDTDGRSHQTIDLWDREHASWRWRVMLTELTRIDDQDNSRAGWASVVAAVEGYDGSLYAPFRPFFIYLGPWPYPSILAWPDAWLGPVVLAIRNPSRRLGELT